MLSCKLTNGPPMLHRSSAKARVKALETLPDDPSEQLRVS